MRGSERGHVVSPLFPDQRLCPQLPWLLLCPPFPGHIRLDSSSSHIHSTLRSTAATASRVIWMYNSLCSDLRISTFKFRADKVRQDYRNILYLCRWLHNPYVTQRASQLSSNKYMENVEQKKKRLRQVTLIHFDKVCLKNENTFLWKCHFSFRNIV